MCVCVFVRLCHQMIIFAIIILLSQLVFTYLMATITACLTNADSARARFSEKLYNARLYMIQEGLDSQLRQRVINYYRYLWKRTKGVEPNQLFLSLPRSIWGSVSFCLYGNLIRYAVLSCGVVTTTIRQPFDGLWREFALSECQLYLKTILCMCLIAQCIITTLDAITTYT